MLIASPARRLAWVPAMLALISCVSAARRDLALTHDRIDKLRPLSRWTARTCVVDATLTQPAAARYAQLYPADEATARGEPLRYRWRASEAACSVQPDRASTVADDFGAVLTAGLCLLVQTHFVNSPFDEISVTPSILRGDKHAILIRTGTDADLGLKLNRKEFTIETRTKSRGNFLAEYAAANQRFVPTRLTQSAGGAVIELNNLEYALIGEPVDRALRRFTIGVGEAHALPVAVVTVGACEPI